MSETPRSAKAWAKCWPIKNEGARAVAYDALPILLESEALERENTALKRLLREVRGGADTLIGKVELAQRIDAALGVPIPFPCNGGGPSDG